MANMVTLLLNILNKVTCILYNLNNYKIILNALIIKIKI